MCLFEGRISSFSTPWPSQCNVQWSCWVAKTWKRVRVNLWWHEMQWSIKRYIKSCKICQQSKTHTLKPTKIGDSQHELGGGWTWILSLAWHLLGMVMMPSLCLWISCPNWPALCQPRHLSLLKERQGYIVIMCINLMVYPKQLQMTWMLNSQVGFGMHCMVFGDKVSFVHHISSSNQ